MKLCYRIGEIQVDCLRLANVESGEHETPLGQKGTPPGESKVGEKVNSVCEKKIFVLRSDKDKS